MVEVPAQTQVMGVVNVTPDSFSDGGRFLDPAAAIAHGLRLLAEGADLLDVGAESTRPRAAPVSEAEEIARLIPVIRGLAENTEAPISVDTMKPAVARAAVAAGASIWNDVTALRFAPESPQVAAELGCRVVLMHMLGEPGTMQDDPRYEDVVSEVGAFLAERSLSVQQAGVRRDNILLDPGIGFGKTLAHNLTLLARMDELTCFDLPVVLGASRKRFIAGLDPTAESATDRLGGSLAAALAGARSGAAIVRVHDVRQTVQALTVQGAILGARL